MERYKTRIRSHDKYRHSKSLRCAKEGPKSVVVVPWKYCHRFCCTDGRTADTECYSYPKKNLTVVDGVWCGGGGGGDRGVEAFQGGLVYRDVGIHVGL